MSPADAPPSLPSPYGSPTGSPAYPLALAPGAYPPASARPFRDGLAWHLSGGVYRVGVLGVKAAILVGGVVLLTRAWGKIAAWVRARRAEDARVEVRDVTPTNASDIDGAAGATAGPGPTRGPASARPASVLPAPLARVSFDYAELTPPPPIAAPRKSPARRRARA